MSTQDHYAHTQFGIDEVYFHSGFPLNLLEKLQQRAVVCLDSEDDVVLNHVSNDIILIFHKRVPNRNLACRFLKFLHQYSDKENFIKSNTLLNEEELFSAVKSKNFILITHRILFKETCHPILN